MCAIGDPLILNTGNYDERGIVKLFDKTAQAANKLKGTDLFKGKLEFCLRDIEIS